MSSSALSRSNDEELGLERLQRTPIIDRIDARTLQLIERTIAPGCTTAEIGHFLELCAHYDLDPFAREAWCAKGKSGKLLIMVGRDGLRKIAHRNGLHLDCDVVRANDDFAVVRTPDGNRTIAHSYKNPRERGEIIGAWAECREGGPEGRPMGYFYAPVEEYKPDNVSGYSPWAKQLGVMILAAAERQAVRQATPLSGLLAIGEDEIVNETVLGTVDEEPEQSVRNLPDAVEGLLVRAAELGHDGLSDRATAEMTVTGQSDEFVSEWVDRANAELDVMEVHAMRARAALLLDQATVLREKKETDAADDLEDEAARLDAEASEMERADATDDA